MVNCYFCKGEFSRKDNLQKHLKTGKCLVGNNMTLLDFHNQISDLNEKINTSLTISDSENTIVQSPNSTINNLSMNVKIEINVNPINKLSIDHLAPEKMKELVEKLDCNSSKLNLLLSDYIKDIVCDPAHPENHAVRYIKKKPPTFNSVIEKNGETINTIKNLNDTCELLTDPILGQLKEKLREFLRKYKKETDPVFDYSFYEDTVQRLKIELNKENVKKALNSVLQNDILNEIKMKLTIE